MLQLLRRTGSNNHNYNESGNVLLDHLHGAVAEKRPGGVDMQAEMETVAAGLRATLRKVYIMPIALSPDLFPGARGD